MANLNLNFTYNWQNQKNIAGKKNKIEIVSSNARPATNGCWDKSQSGDLDGNAFIPRPIKAWRKQLQPDSIRGGTKYKNIILESEQPGRIITPDDNCCNTTNNITTQFVSNLSSDKFNNFNTDNITTITYDDIVNCQNGPVGKNICCNPEKNIIKYSQTTPIKNHFIDTSSYLQRKCNIYTQSYTKSSNIDYFNIYGLALYPNDNSIGPQSLINSKCYKTCKTNCPSILNKPYNQNLTEKYSIYKPNNREYSTQGAVSSSSRISNLKNNTISKYGSYANNAYGLYNVNYTNIIKDKNLLQY